MKLKIRKMHSQRRVTAKDARIGGLSRSTREGGITTVVNLLVYVQEHERHPQKMEILITPDDAASPYFQGLIDDLIHLRDQHVKLTKK